MFLYQSCLFTWMLLFMYAGCNESTAEMGKELKFKVSHYKQPCMGEELQLCFLVSRDGGKPELFYDKIEGFNYSWGYNYEISVIKTVVPNPKADGSSFTYRLKKVIEKIKSPANETFGLPLKIDGISAITSMEGICSLNREIKINTPDLSCTDLMNSDSAIFRHSEYGLILVKIK